MYIISSEWSEMRCPRETYTGCFFYWFCPKSSKCWRWQNPTKKVKEKVKEMGSFNSNFHFLVGILPSPTLRTFRAEPVKKITLYKYK